MRDRSAEARHARFAPGPPTNPRRVNFYGHFKRGATAKRFHMNQVHSKALRENAARRG